MRFGRQYEIQLAVTTLRGHFARFYVLRKRVNGLLKALASNMSLNVRMLLIAGGDQLTALIKFFRSGVSAPRPRLSCKHSHPRATPRHRSSGFTSCVRAATHRNNKACCAALHVRALSYTSRTVAHMRALEYELRAQVTITS